MFEVSVVYILREGARGDEVLLGEKLTGLGIGKIVGPGGKQEPGESPVETALREVYEEVGLTLEAEDSFSPGAGYLPLCGAGGTLPALPCFRHPGVEWRSAG
jgi:8-oxo-dGTP pyrophosphatase MutT (NUDIX family)